MLNIACVNAGNYAGRGAEYVNTLFDMVGRHISGAIEKRFVCFTDDPDGLAAGIEVRFLPPGLNGWWNKLFLFSKEAFESGDRVLYFDLDTVITGSVDSIARYKGDFAILGDFYRPEGWQSAVMAWRAGLFAELWDRWNAEGRPELAGGDQAWIERCFKGVEWLPEIWQDLFPGRFKSYKAHGLRNTMPPRETAVVCFHGYPRPHECGSEWVGNIWKLGGWAAADIDTCCNVSDARLRENVRRSAATEIPRVQEIPAHDGQALIVGGAPSLKADLGELRRFSAAGATVFALNNAASFLHAEGVTPDWQVIMDARFENAAFVQPHVAKGRLIASQVDESVLHRAAACGNTQLWHCLIEEMRADLPQWESQRALLIGGGTTVLTRTMNLAYLMGFRRIHLYGADSSYAEGEHHAYAQAVNDGDRAEEVICMGRKFRAAPWMIAQVNEFQAIAAMLAELDCEIVVHGRGLLPFVALMMERRTA